MRLLLILAYLFLALLGAMGVALIGYLLLDTWGVSFVTATATSWLAFLYVVTAVTFRAVLSLALNEPSITSELFPEEDASE